MKVNYIIVGLLVLSQQMLAQQPTLFNYFPTNQSATFYGQAQIDGIIATSNDWIAAFDTSGNCAGASQIIVNSGIAYINLVIYGDDPTSTTIDEGISGTEDFYLKIYDYSNGIYIDFPSSNNVNSFSGWTNTNGAPLPTYSNIGTIYNFINTFSVTLSLNINICENDQPIQLYGGAPSGGFYSGNYVSAGFFDPTISGPGNHIIQYNYNGSIAIDTVNVFELADATLVTSGPFCDSDSSVNLISLTNGGLYAGSGVISNVFYPSVVGAGSYWISYSLTDSNQCFQVVNNLIIVSPTPITPTIIQNGNLLECSTIGDNYIWYDANMNILQNSTNSTFSPLNSGDYYVEVFSNQCSNLSDSFTFSFISSLNEKTFHIHQYENKIEIIGLDFIAAHIFDTNASICISSNDKSINLCSLEKGIYFLRIDLNNKETYTFKFIK